MAVAKKGFKIFDTTGSSYGEGGGGWFPPGKYRIDKSVFANWADGGPSYFLAAQRLGEGGKDIGDPVEQHYGIALEGGAGMPTNEWIEMNRRELKILDGGKRLQEVEDHPIRKTCDFYYFMEALAKATNAADVIDEAGEDVTVLEGMIAEFAKVPHPKGGTHTDKKTGREYPNVLVVITEFVKSGSGSGKSAPAAKGKPVNGKPRMSEEEQFIVEYVADKVLTDKAAKSSGSDGIQIIAVKLDIRRAAKKAFPDDNSKVNAIKELFDDTDWWAKTLKNYFPEWTMDEEKFLHEEE